MSDINQSANRIKNRPWAALLPVLLLAPLAMAPKGCGPVAVGDVCPDEEVCIAGTGGEPTGGAGAAGSKPTGNAGSAGKPTGNGGSAGKPTGNGGSAGKPTGTGGSSGGNSCGGLLGLSCAANEYCAFDPKAACGAADQTGVCTTKPRVCPDIYAPVCACDGKTYSSDCEAAGRGSSVLHTGVCEEPTPGTSCGGLKPATCEKSEYCNFPIETKCGSGDQTGTCTKVPPACDAVYDPVCGCDGATYSSACTAAAKGVSVLHSGTCDGATPGAVCGGLLGLTCAKNEFCDFPTDTKCGSGDQTGTCTAIPVGCDKAAETVCGCDGNTYGNPCTAHLSGVSVATAGACGGTTCGGKTGKTCDTNQYCSYPLSAQCGSFDAPGTCVAKFKGACTADYNPVCGCDGKTYGNSCTAALAAMSIASEGACP